MPDNDSSEDRQRGFGLVLFLNYRLTPQQQRGSYLGRDNDHIRMNPTTRTHCPTLNILPHRKGANKYINHLESKLKRYHYRFYNLYDKNHAAAVPSDLNEG